MLDLQSTIGRNVRMAPGGRVIAMAADRHSDTHLALVHADPFSLAARLKHEALRDAIL
jgi:hypothetical protein